MPAFTIDIDSEVLVRFYEAVDASPSLDEYPNAASWSEAELDQWRKTVHLEPFINLALAKAGAEQLERTSVRMARQTAADEAMTINVRLSTNARASLDNLPNKLRPVKPTVPVVNSTNR